MLVMSVMLLPGLMIAYFKAFNRPSKDRRPYFRHKKRVPLGQTTSIFLLEAKKLFLDQKVFLLLLLAVFVQFLLFRNGKESFRLDERTYRYYTEMLEGPVSTDTRNFLLQEEQRFRELKKSSLLTSKELSELLLEDGFQRTMAKYQYLSEREGSYFFYDTGYDRLFARDTLKRDFLLNLFLIMVLMLSQTGVFCRDCETGLIHLISTTNKGRKGLRIRFFLGAVLSVFVCFITYVPFLLRTLFDYGTGGLTAPANSLYGVPVSVTFPVWVLVLCLFLSRLLGTFFVSSMIYLFSFWRKSTAGTILFTVLLFCPLLLPLLREKLGILLYPYAPISGNLLVLYPPFFTVLILVLYLGGILTLTSFLIKKGKYI